MYSYNRIHNDYDTNVVRVELNSSSSQPSYRPHTTSVIRTTRTTSREPLKSTAIVNRSETFTKNERPSLSRNSNGNNDNSNSNSNNNNSNSGIIRSETFIVKQHHSGIEDNSSDERNKYQQKHQRKVSYSDEHEKVNYGTYTRSSKKNSLASEGKYDRDDKSNYSTYTRSSKREKEKRGNGGYMKDCLFLFLFLL